MNRKNMERKLLFLVTVLLLSSFLMIPLVLLVSKSIGTTSDGIFTYYAQVFASNNLALSIKHSMAVSLSCSLLTTFIAFLLAYTVSYTNVSKKIKRLIEIGAVAPMLLPTITYGFAIIYAFGKQGLVTKIFGRQIIHIYGFYGLLLGYLIYTLPVSFLLIRNAMAYIDKKYIVVSKLMGDSQIRTFWITVIRPLIPTIFVSIVQTFFLSFTDFGIPASIGGEYEVIATTLYYEMLGSIPNFNHGAVIAVIMLVPSVISICLLSYINKYQIQYDKISNIQYSKHPIRDGFFGIVSVGILLAIATIFSVIVIVPLVNGWPYDLSITTKNIMSVFQDNTLVNVFKNSLLVGILTGIFGTVMTYLAALATARNKLSKYCNQIVNIGAMIANTVPGMVLGIGYLFVFSGTPLQNTIVLIVICNIIHFFSTPYIMFQNSIQKINPSLEYASELMGDSWIQTVIRVITPNIKATFLEVFSYYFINGMVTVSAIIFITGAKTMVITTKIKELQHFAKFNEIFILSIFLFLCNLLVKGITLYGVNKTNKNKEKKEVKLFSKVQKNKTYKVFVAILIVGIVSIFVGKEYLFDKEEDKVIIYSNADDEAVIAMEEALNENGYEGKYMFQSYGTSELGGKLLAEGTKIEADIVTMSSFYLETSQEQHQMFAALEFKPETIMDTPSFYAPITSQEGAIIINTKELEKNQLPMPTSLKDLANPIYKNQISIPDIKGSSTGWLLIQALLSEYGEEEAKELLHQIYENVGPHLESSGSGPIKKIRAGEVSIGFGLRHQVISDMKEGLPIALVDPIEGNFTLTESIAVINKNKKHSLAMEMAECIIKEGRKGIQTYYPNPIYEGEESDPMAVSSYPKVFSEKLTVDLLERHQKLSDECK